MSGPSEPEHRSILIRDICSHRSWYTVNREYQRDEDIWSGEDKKYLIDSILKGFDIPKIYLRQLEDQRFEIVDGQQRIDTIWKFRDDKITLEGAISGRDLHGKQYSDLPDGIRKDFDEYKLDVVVLKDYDDEKVRDLFTRLQRGKPLNPAERLNAFPGPIVPAMRSLGGHIFFKRVNFSLRRYHSYLIAARMMALEHGLEHYDSFGDIGPDRLYSFFSEQKHLDLESREVQAVKQNLDFLAQAFPSQREELSSEVWVINLYMLTAFLRKHYAMKGREAKLASFYTFFWREAEDFRQQKIQPRVNRITTDFVIAISSATGSKERLEIRKKEVVTNFLDQTPGLEILDANRLFNTYEKIVIYQRGNGKCVVCNRDVSWADFEADHIRPWSQGGKTTLDNAQLLCREDNRAKGASF